MKRLWVVALVLAVAGCHGPASMPGNPPAAQAGANAKSPRGSASIVVDPSKSGAVVSSLVMGANMATWYDVTQSGLAPAFKKAGMTATRWPGGSESDNFHWKTNSLGQGDCSGGYVNPNSTFDNFVKDIAHAAKLDIAITVNYGSNPACTDGADPSEAAGWVAYANATKRYHVMWWSVGNEEYGSWETDKHSQPHDPTQYAQNVASYFYPQMKAAASSPINVCVDVDPSTSGWDSTVLAQASYDCVELHYYPQGTTVNDDFLIHQAAPGITTYLNQLKAELQTAGRPNTPIYVGEIGSTYGTPGKQTMSITQALYAGQILGELLEDGVSRATWWLGYGGCNSKNGGGDFSKSLYGWQDFGGFMLFSDGTVQEGCTSEDVPRGTLLPTGRTYQVASHFVRDGEHMLGLSKTSLPSVRAYASTYAGGYALMLFNLNKSTAVNVPITIDGKSSGSGGTVYTYDKTLYDASKHGAWKGPTSATLPPWNGSFTLQLPPWSIVVAQTN
ncbi:MAG: hypothetical protein WB615_09915 [Candidatus Tumulicola sp.]